MSPFTFIKLKHVSFQSTLILLVKYFFNDVAFHSILLINDFILDQEFIFFFTNTLRFIKTVGDLCHEYVKI